MPDTHADLHLPVEDDPAYNPLAIFDPDSPINPHFMDEAVRTLMRALPLDPEEPEAWRHRRMHCALIGLAGLHPRDEIEVMLAVQALCAYHAAGTAWYLGMNQRRPCGDNVRHVSAANASARTFDTLLRALERRQARPLTPPPGRPPPQAWPPANSTAVMQATEARVNQAGAAADPCIEVVWNQRQVEIAEQVVQQAQTDWENEGLDLANTEGILPGGGMIMPEFPTPQQEAYMGRRLVLAMQRDYQTNLKNGLTGAAARPKIRLLRIGDLIP
jgi:hypothetical protein